MLHAKPRLHPERRAFLDREGMFVQVLEGARFGQVDDDVGTAVDFEPQGQDDHGAFVVRVGGERVAGAEAEGFFPFAEGFVVLVCFGWKLGGRILWRLGEYYGLGVWKGG